MRPRSTCDQCGAPVVPTVNGGTLDPNPHPDGYVTVDRYHEKPLVTDWGTPDNVPRNRPFRYRLHHCPTDRD